MSDLEKRLFIIGKNINNYRTKNKIPIEEFSEKTQISTVYINKIEQGKAKGINLNKLLIIADVLNVPVQKLFE